MFLESRQMFLESRQMFLEPRQMFPESRQMFPEWSGTFVTVFVAFPTSFCFLFATPARLYIRNPENQKLLALLGSFTLKSLIMPLG
jgi:hypothetical protein